MHRIHVARNHQPIGQFTAEDVATGLKTGEFLPTDLAWREPMESWKPLSEFTDLPEVEEPPIVPPRLPDPEPVAVAEPAWERRVTLGWFRALTQTVRQVLSAPVETFKAMKCDGGFGGPLWFHVVMLSVTSWIWMIYQIIAIRVNPDAVLGSMATRVTPAELESGMYLLMFLAPAFIAAGAFVTSGLVHAAFMALGCVKKPFQATFRAVCYAFGAAAVFQLIPTVCGGLVYFSAGLIFLVLALREIHGTDTWRAALGVTIPAVVCCGLTIGFYAVTGAIALSQGLVR